MKNRESVAAGRFYSDNKITLLKDLSKHFSQTKAYENDKAVQAIIAPHAGYVYSGKVAAKAFSSINPNASFNNIFVLASSHQCNFNGASIYNKGNYKTPLGEVVVNHGLVNKLIAEHAVFTFYNQAHKNEHSIEVQLPFLQYHMNTNVLIVPIVIGSQSESVIQDITHALKPYFNENNLFVVSSDFSHFPNYNDASKADESTANAIVENDSKALFKVIQDNNSVKGLSTSACGLAGILVLMNLAKSKQDYCFNKIAYKNSGDSLFGDKKRVVGYWAIALMKCYKQQKDSKLSKANKTSLLNICKKSIIQRKFTNDLLDQEEITLNLHEQCGVFVSVYVNSILRGCIGRFKSNKPLYELVGRVGVQAAYNDHRFESIAPDELGAMKIEISVISPFQQIHSIDKFILGKHGIYIRKGINSGTFLPQVAAKTGWSKETFLGHCSKDKAGIGWDGWRNAELFIYTAEVFEES